MSHSEIYVEFLTVNHRIKSHFFLHRIEFYFGEYVFYFINNEHFYSYKSFEGYFYE